MHFGNPLRWQWVCVLGLSGVVSWWTQEWHSVFPYLIRYNVCLLLCMSLFLAPRGRRKLLLVGAMAYALPALAGPWGFGLSVAVMFAVAESARLQRFFTDWRVLALLWLAAAWLMVEAHMITYWCTFSVWETNRLSAATNPSRQPVMAKALEKPEMRMVLSFMPGIWARDT